MQVCLESCRLERSSELLHIVADLGANKGVHSGGGKTFELPELWGNGGGCCDKTLWIFFHDDGAGTLFVCRVEVGKQKADRNGLDARGLEFTGHLAYGGLVQGNQHVTMRRYQAFRYGLTKPAPHQWAILPRDILHDGVM